MTPRVIITRGATSVIDAYVRALREAGAETIELLPGMEIPEFDAVCLAGGPDVEPWRYGQAPGGSEKPDIPRDALELDEVLPRAWGSDRPILAICRGVQVLNVFREGTLLQHIGEDHRAKGDDVKPHIVTVEPSSRLARIIGTTVVVNSRHHQVIDRLGTGLRATAWADSHIEAVEAPQQRWVVGVQWHPERTAEVDPAAVRVFEEFVKAAEPVRAR